MPRKASVLVACSGGADSVALLRCLHALGYSLAVAHVNYGLRGADADADEAFVRTLAGALGLPSFIKKADPKALKSSPNSLQADARAIRYAFFESILKEEGYNFCATGHHENDQVETSILSLMRGAGPALMHGIPHKRGAFVRPLLHVSRAEILAYLNAIAQPYRTDASNAGDAYLRNRIRHEVLPALDRIHPNASERLASQQDWYNKENTFLRGILQPFVQQAANKQLDWSSFITQYGEEHVPVLVAYVLADWGITGPRNRAGLALINNQVGTGIDVQGGRLERVRNGLELRKEKDTTLIRPLFIQEISESMLIDLGKRKIEITLHESGRPDFSKPDLHVINLDEVSFPVHFRGWQQGDRMQPLGMRGEKLLSDIFIDKKYTSEQKERAVVVADEKGIICLSEFRIANRVRLHQGSQRFVSLKFL